MPRRYKFLVIFLICFVFYATDSFAGQKRDSFNIAIFREENFPYMGTPDGLTIDWIGRNLEEYDVIYLNTDKLGDKGLFNADRLDLLILPYGEAVPEKGLPAIVEFIRNGGGLFTTAGRPFGCISKKKEKGFRQRN